jgi:drug/metabolite transporter (DMT)-like permease
MEDLSASLRWTMEDNARFCQSFWRTEGGALLIMFISAILLSVQGLFLQLANNDGLGFQIGELIFARCFAQLIVSSGYIWSTGTPWLGTPKERVPVILRGLFGGICTGLWFYATIVLPLGDAIALISLHPVLTCFCAFCILGEQLSVVHFASLALCIVGAFLICQPDFMFHENLDDRETHLGYIAAFSAALCYTVIFICMRSAKQADPFSLMFSLAVFGTGLGLWLALSEEQRFQGNYLYLFLTIVTGLLSQWTLNFAGRVARAGLGSIVRCSDIVWAYGFEILIFHEEVNLYTILGFCSVLLSVFFVGVSTLTTNPKKIQEEPLLS